MPSFGPSRSLLRCSRTRAPWLSAVVLLGCATEGPPYEELSLRDALQAEPSAIAELPRARRERLADRYATAFATQSAEGSVNRDAALDAPGYATRLDDSRASLGLDSIVALNAELGAHEVTLRTPGQAADGGVGVVAPATSLSDLAMWVDDERLLEEPYASALEGPAGELIAQMAAEAGASRILASASVPVGLVSDGEALYVNLAWLIAFADAAALDGLSVGRTSATLQGSPYGALHYGDCVLQEQSRCSACLAGGSCGGEPDLVNSFTTLQEQCTWLEMNSARYEWLCVVGMMSVRSVRTCVEGTVGTCPAVDTAPSLESVDGASAFHGDATCLAALQDCGLDRVPATTCANPCEAFLASLVGACVDSCSASCSPSCSGCSGCSGSSCSSSSCSSSSCSSGSCSGGSCGGSACTVAEAKLENERDVGRPAHRSRDPNTPWAVVWLLLPVAYLIARGRKS